MAYHITLIFPNVFSKKDITACALAININDIDMNKTLVSNKKYIFLIYIDFTFRHD